MLNEVECTIARLLIYHCVMSKPIRLDLIDCTVRCIILVDGREFRSYVLLLLYLFEFSYVILCSTLLNDVVHYF